MTEIRLSSSAIDSKLWDIYLASRVADSIYAVYASWSIHWYVQTGRAHIAWAKALLKADADKLIAYVSKARVGCDDEIIERVTSYLKRYCKLGG